MTIWRPKDQIWSGLDSIIKIFFAQTNGLWKLSIAGCYLRRISLEKICRENSSNTVLFFNFSKNCLQKLIKSVHWCKEYHWKVWWKFVIWQHYGCAFKFCTLFSKLARKNSSNHNGLWWKSLKNINKIRQMAVSHMGLFFNFACYF